MNKLPRQTKKRLPANGRWTREYRNEWNRQWIKNNRERYNASKYAYRERTKLEVLAYYGKGKLICNYCGFNNIDALCLDHINNDGAEHRRQLKISSRYGKYNGTNTYEALKKAGFPEGLQLLCANCNMIKELQRKRKKRLENPFYKTVYEGGEPKDANH